MRWLLFLLALLAGCGGKPDPIPLEAVDGGVADFSASDGAAATDAFTPDAGPDASVDGGVPDGGDAGPSDAPAEGG